MTFLALATLLIAQDVSSTPPANVDRPPATEIPAVTVRAATAAEEARAGRRLVCRNETVLGSRFPVRRCRPADQTPQERALAADQLRRQQSVTMPGCL